MAAVLGQRQGGGQDGGLGEGGETLVGTSWMETTISRYVTSNRRYR